MVSAMSYGKFWRIPCHTWKQGMDWNKRNAAKSVADERMTYFCLEAFKSQNDPQNAAFTPIVSNLSSVFLQIFGLTNTSAACTGIQLSELPFQQRRMARYNCSFYLSVNLKNSVQCFLL